jgi:hypothetical protein
VTADPEGSHVDGGGTTMDSDRDHVQPTASEREVFASRLREGVGSGVLSLEEFETRLETVYTARSLRELERLVQWLPPPVVARRRLGGRSPLIIAGAAIILLIVFAGVMIAAGRRSATDGGSALSQPSGVTGVTAPFGPSDDAVAPVITAVVPVLHPDDGKYYAKVYVTWPPGTHLGCLATLIGSEACGPPLNSIVDPNPILQPLSYRAVACFAGAATCNSGGGSTPTQTLGPWYRPRIDGSLLNLRPAAPNVTRDPSSEAYHVSINLTQQPTAPAFIIVRNGIALTTLLVALKQEYCQPNVLCVEDTVAGVTGSSISYAISACYSDCLPEELTGGFAQATAPGPAVSVPGLAGP